MIDLETNETTCKAVISLEERAVRKARFDGRTFYLYLHRRKDNRQPFYIGQASKPEKLRYPCEEFRRAYQSDGRNDDWKRVVLEAGGYTVEIILDNLSNANIDDKEIEFIALYGRVINGGVLCNQTDGGRWDYNGVRTREIIDRIAETQTMTIQDNIDKYVFPEANTGCWLWAGCIDHHTNRMILSYQKKDREARKVIYEYLHNTKLVKGEYIVNTCGCGICINPDHTKFIKTPPTDDKRNTRKGEAVWKVILTEEQVIEIKKRIINESSNAKIAKDYNVDRTTIYRIRTGQNWGWLNV